MTGDAPQEAVDSAVVGARGDMSASRLETFSDGVFAIAATLLVLDIGQSDDGTGSLLHQLFTGPLVSEYAAYAVSFLIIGITWINHHSLFCQVARVDRRLTILNLLLLMMLAFTPFPTRVLAANLTKGGADAHAAAFFYSLSITLCGLLYGAVWWHASSRNGALLKVPMDDATVRQTRTQFGVGNLVYLATLGLSFLSAPLTLGFHAAVAIYYAFDPLRRR
ncbi:MAG: DUF1211 domain-containing protein [Frankiaceae bacterium]|nr:DUF1211 domain-containing protein [Frankiaceae bacterium]MBV9870216.1 DUF1211 domain-containing protein [Frankiaceae bacterium]